MSKYVAEETKEYELAVKFWETAKELVADEVSNKYSFSKAAVVDWLGDMTYGLVDDIIISKIGVEDTEIILAETVVEIQNILVKEVDYFYSCMKNTHNEPDPDKGSGSLVKGIDINNLKDVGGSMVRVELSDDEIRELAGKYESSKMQLSLDMIDNIAELANFSNDISWLFRADGSFRLAAFCGIITAVNNNDMLFDLDLLLEYVPKALKVREWAEAMNIKNAHEALASRMHFGKAKTDEYYRKLCRSYVMLGNVKEAV